MLVLLLLLILLLLLGLPTAIQIDLLLTVLWLEVMTWRRDLVTLQSLVGLARVVGLVVCTIHSSRCACKDCKTSDLTISEAGAGNQQFHAMPFHFGSNYPQATS